MKRLTFVAAALVAVACSGKSAAPNIKAFVITFPGSDAWAGTAVNAAIKAQDAFGNPVTGYTGTVTLTSSDSAISGKPASITFAPADAGAKTVAVTFNSIGLQTLTATDAAAPAITGTGTQTVHGLVYTNPASGGKVRLILDAAASSASLVQLDLVSNTTLFPLTLGTADTVRNGVFAAGMNLPLDTTKVGADTTLLVTTPPTGSTNILSLGSGTLAKGAAINGTTGILYSGVSQKRIDTTAGASSNNMRGDVAVRPFPGNTSFYYSLRLRLTPNAPAGTVFDGQAFASTFRAAVRDRSGSDVFSGPDFAIGKLEVK